MAESIKLYLTTVSCLHSWLTSALDEAQWSASRSGRFYVLFRSFNTYLGRRLCGP